MELDILKKELVFSTSRSSGAGGQHVNKVETKVELRFDVLNSSLLNEDQKILVSTRLASRLTKDGVLLLTNQDSRSQRANKEAVISFFYEIMEEALKPPKKRKKIVPLVSSPEKRITRKKELSEKKVRRKKVIFPPESDLCAL